MHNKLTSETLVHQAEVVEHAITVLEQAGLRQAARMLPVTILPARHTTSMHYVSCAVSWLTRGSGSIATTATGFWGSHNLI